jgi:hypothetical protein
LLNASIVVTLVAVRYFSTCWIEWLPDDAKRAAFDGPQIGFIAQEVQPILPQLVLNDSGTTTITLTDGSTQQIPNTLSLNYQKLVVPLVKAVQEIASITDAFKTNLIAWFADATNGITDFFAANIHAKNELCVGDTCVTPAQFKAMVAAANASQAEGTLSAIGESSDDSGGSTPPAGSATTTPDIPPVISINGDNPAHINVGGTDNDLGATITGPQADINLGIKTFLNGALISNIVLDTSAVATDTIDYVATDQAGNTSTSTRAVIVESPAAAEPAPTP